MSYQFDSNPPPNRFASVRAILNRWGFLRTPALAFAEAKLAPMMAKGRRPGAAKPVYIEVSPAMVDPFPEPRTIPGGWDLSELVKSR